MVINTLVAEAYESMKSVFGDKFAKLVRPAMAEGCVDLELANDVKIELANNEPMVVFKFKRKTVRVPRHSFESITIM